MPFGCQLRGVDPVNDVPSVERMPLEQALHGADLVIAALPLTAETRNLVDASAIACLPKGALLVNIGRGSTVDEMAVAEALTNLMAVLESQGMTAANLVKCSLFLRDMADFAAVNAIYSEFMGDAKPARETVAVLGLPKDARFEISAVAYLPL